MEIISSSSGKTTSTFVTSGETTTEIDNRLLENQLEEEKDPKEQFLNNTTGAFISTLF